MARFTFDQVQYDLVPTGEWTFQEAKVAKRTSGGMSVAAIERGVVDADPDALTAMVVVSVMRAWKEATPQMIVARLDEMSGSLAGMLEEIGRTAEEEQAGDPPTETEPVADAEPDPVMAGTTL